MKSFIHKHKKITSWLCVVLALTLFFIVRGLVAKEKVDELSYHTPYYKNDNILEPSYSEYLRSLTSKASGTTNKTVNYKDFVFNNNLEVIDDEAVKINNKEQLKVKFSNYQAGMYNLSINFMYDGNDILPIKLAILVNGEYLYYELRSVNLPIKWQVKDSYKKIGAIQNEFNFSSDRYGNDLQPNTEIISEFKDTYVYDSSYYHINPLMFYLDGEEIEFTIKSLSDNIIIKDISILKPIETISYSEYKENQSNVELAKNTITLESEYYSYKSDPSTKLSSDTNANSTPYKTSKKFLNSIDSATFNSPGQSISWEFNVPESGYYYLTFKYIQNTNLDMPAFREILVDDELLFKELQDYSFQYTSNWKNETINIDGENVAFYFSKGTHSISLRVSIEKYREVIESLQSVIRDINDLALDIKKYTAGTSTDADRDYSMLDVIPDLVEQLTKMRNTIDNAYRYANSLNDSEYVSTDLNSLKLSIETLDEFIEDPNTIATELSKFSEGSSSISQYLSTQILDLTTSPLGLEKIYLNNDSKLPKAKASGFRTFFEEIKKFFLSFKNNEYNDLENDSEAINVWVNRPRVYVELMQQMIDEGFTKETGIKVKLSLMPSTNKLVLANAAGRQPDLAMGVGSSTTFEFALREAAVDFRQFEGYEEIVKNFSKGVMIPYVYNDGVYGLPEVQSFYLTFYRTDILNKLSLGDSIPNTWDDVKAILPELQNYGMNYYIPLASDTAYKSFSFTLPFYYQNRAGLYSADGTKTVIDSEEGIKAMKLMTELFTTYALQAQVSSFYNHFRYGTIPIGISSNDTYVKLLIAAPEIKNNWSIALYPGVQDETTGEILRYAPVSSSGVMMFKTDRDQNKVFEFVKWWFKTEVQEQFAFDLQTMYGKEFIWFTSNREAFKTLSIPEEHKDIILNQWDWAAEAPSVPGSYMLEREISNSWNKIALNNQNIRDTLETAVITVNRELERKLEEFKYIKDGIKVKDYIIPTADNIDYWLKERKGD